MHESDGRGDPWADLGELAAHPSRGSGAVDHAVLAELVGRRGWTQTRAAEFFAVSGAAVSKALKRMKLAISRDTAAGQAAPALLEAQLDTGERFKAMAKQCEDLLQLCRIVTDDGMDRAKVAEAQAKLRRLAGPKGNLGELAVKLMSEGRKQMEFTFAIQKELYNLKRVEEFQAVVLEEIKAASPEIQQRIMERLAKVQAFRQGVEISQNSGGASFA